MSNHHGFFTSDSNDMFHSVQGAYLTSSTSSCHFGSSKGLGTYMYKDNFRRCISLFCVRSIPKHNWINSSNVYIADKEIIENGK
jgi:hypothetical protein